jgi:hypothetical protein
MTGLFRSKRGNRAPECPRLLGALAMTNDVVRVPLERDVRKPPRHPRVERAMQEEICPAGRDTPPCGFPPCATRHFRPPFAPRPSASARYVLRSETVAVGCPAVARERKRRLWNAELARSVKLLSAAVLGNSGKEHASRERLSRYMHVAWVAALGETTGRLEEDADVFRRQNVLVED